MNSKILTSRKEAYRVEYVAKFSGPGTLLFPNPVAHRFTDSPALQVIAGE